MSLTALERVVALCDETESRLAGGETKAALLAVRERVRGPLHVAVAGRLKAGKSTLVNALIGERVAPTADVECTRLVTWFRWDVTARVEVRYMDGSVVQLPLIDGRIPDDLGASFEEIAGIDVYLPNKKLEHMTLIDTPGLSSLNERYSERTARLLHGASARASGDAEALIFVTGHVRQEDVDALTDFHRLVGSTEANPATAVGVISHADQISGSADGDLSEAHRVADHYARELRSVVSAVVPVAGLIAETVETGGLSERNAGWLRRLAENDTVDRELLLDTPGDFEKLAQPLPLEERRQLLDRVGVYGAARALEVAGRGEATPINDHLRAICGIEPLHKLIDETFAKHAAVLKVRRALQELERLSWADGERSVLAGLRDRIEELQLHPSMHRLNELTALQLAAGDGVVLPDDLRDDLQRIAGAQGVKPAGGRRWREFRNTDATGPAVRIADILIRSYELEGVA